MHCGTGGSPGLRRGPIRAKRHCLIFGHMCNLFVVKCIPFSEVSALVGQAPTSAPGPDGVSYAHWANAGPAAVKILYGAYTAIANAAQPPASFIAASLVYIPEASGGAFAEVAYTAMPRDLRPLTLSIVDQKIVARGVNVAWATIAQDMVHAVQRGFMKGRHILSNVAEVEGARIEYSRSRDGRGIILLDIEAAFPSLGWPILRYALSAIGAPPWVVAVVFALYHGTGVEMYLNGAGTTEFMNIEAGIKYGCPTSESLWAIAYDPIVGLLCGRIPPHIGRLTCFADDPAVAARDAYIAFVFVLACFAYITAASCLRLKTNKTVVINYVLALRRFRLERCALRRYAGRALQGQPRCRVLGHRDRAACRPALLT